MAQPELSSYTTLQPHRQKYRGNASQNSTGQNQLRIIGGKWRGRKLQFPDVEGLRPTGDRIRETVFNWLAPDIIGAHCLDLFAGSGAMGMEALSRGASSATLVEKDQSAADALHQHRQLLSADNAEIIHADALRWLSSAAPDNPFKIVFLDPPFSEQLLAPAIEQLENRQLLAESALIYIETPGDQPSPYTPANWQLCKSKITGQVRYQLFQRV